MHTTQTKKHLAIPPSLSHMRLLPRLYENKHQTYEQEVTIKSNDFSGESRTHQALSGSVIIPKPKPKTYIVTMMHSFGIHRSSKLTQEITHNGLFPSPLPPIFTFYSTLCLFDFR